ncbi:ribonuclease III [Actinotignum sanguinis]|uniref:Ribonuclease 3 n=2 Tax=Actinomycetaceae TaxID=2049 RepID=A0ABZ0REZ6_9ACTO|nr:MULTISPECIES: ribonuclease III [Actinotignum]WPJ89773.1 ribonuclease III [Schaalia turicensis]MDE1552058.1 ribonuclease III [Actinotignum sanguinis]MDE1565828.1 ribonuclease III [Actinotignum sanguinis]MDE1576828.1 ribonuclease III [Actinotignum sanguinis]MDE1642776.1 ribonuclease III [Actinotignum sanguinis]
MAYRELVEQWGIDLPRPLLRRALTHRSFAFEHDEPHNERLEFLGDSILGLIIAEKVFREYPDASEGDMSQMKTYAVSEKALADVARRINLGDSLRLGRGEDRSGGRNKDSILSDTVEALIAATYLEHGMEPTREIVDRLLDSKIKDASVLGPNLDWQTSFEELAHGLGWEGTMEFELSSTGPDHARVFTAVASMAGREWGSGEGSSQKNARHAAAEASYRILADLIEKGEAKPAAGGNGNNGAGGNDGAAPGAGASATPGAAE